MRYRTVLTLLLSCFFSHLAWPQAVGTISGIVEDENAKPVAKANVHIAQTESFSGHHVVRFYETDDGGKFTISHVPWGTYIVMAGKEEDGFADTLAAFYSNLEAPTVVLGPLFPSADVVVRLGPKAGILEIGSIVDAITGKNLVNSSSVTLRRTDNPKFFISTSTTAKHIMVPAQTAVTIEVNAQGYQPWPRDTVQHPFEIRLQPKGVFKLDVKLDPEGTNPTVADLLRELGENNDRFFTFEEGESADELPGKMWVYRLPRPSTKSNLITVLNYMDRTVPNFSYQVDQKDARIIHVMDRRLAEQQEYALERITNSIDFTAAAQNLLNPISTGGKVPVVWMLAPASDDLLSIALDKKVTVKLEGLKTRDALTEILPLPEKGGILWRADTEIGIGKTSTITLCCVRPKK